MFVLQSSKIPLIMYKIFDIVGIKYETVGISQLKPSCLVSRLGNTRNEENCEQGAIECTTIGRTTEYGVQHR